MISIKQGPRHQRTKSKNDKIAEEGRDGDVTLAGLLQSTDREMEPQRAQLTPKGPTASYSADSSR